MYSKQHQGGMGRQAKLYMYVCMYVSVWTQNNLKGIWGDKLSCMSSSKSKTNPCCLRDNMYSFENKSKK